MIAKLISYSKPYEFKTLQRAKVYVNGENLMFDYEKGHQQ